MLDPGEMKERIDRELDAWERREAKRRARRAAISQAKRLALAIGASGKIFSGCGLEMGEGIHADRDVDPYCCDAAYGIEGADSGAPDAFYPVYGIDSGPADLDLVAPDTMYGIPDAGTREVDPYCCDAAYGIDADREDRGPVAPDVMYGIPC